MLTHVVIAACIGLGAALVPDAADAQTMNATRMPVFNEDGTLTFQIRAPQAQTVALRISSLPRQDMTRADNGAWSVTIGPLDPEIYEYSYMVDGVPVIDPANPDIKLSLTPSVSLVEVPRRDGAPMYYTMRDDVSHGVLHHHPHHSRVIGDNREYIVYTPPEYDPGRAEAYPVMYLLHGLSDDQNGWVAAGRANFILDNLIAAGEAVPMVIVMPLGYAPQTETVEGSPWTGWFLGGIPNYSNYVTTELIPRVEAEYNVSDDPDDRAVVGLSMGGAQSLYLGLSHSDTFTWIGAFSSAIQGTGFAGLATDAARLNRNLHLFWIGCGEDDGLLRANRTFIDVLDERGIKYTVNITPGAHEWKVWRSNLHALAPKLFRE